MQAPKIMTKKSAVIISIVIAVGLGSSALHATERTSDFKQNSVVVTKV